MNAKIRKKRIENLYAVIIAGGSGTRFWPLSREETPKQLLSIDGKDTLIQATVKRACTAVGPGRVYVVTGRGQSESIRLQLNSATGIDWDDNFIIEPRARNTAPAIGLAAVYLRHLDPEAVMMVMPSDHIIRNNSRFCEAVMLGARTAKDNYLVTIGIKPDRPETGYGYIKSGKAIKRGIRQVKEFREKPAKDEAVRYLKAGGYFWNSGIFIWRADTVLNEMKKHMPGLYSGLMSIDKAIGTRKLDHTVKSVFSRLKAESIDYGLLEPVSRRGNKVAVVPSAMKWSDVGSWHALDSVLRPDADKNIKKGSVVSIDNENSILYCGSRLVSAIGLKDMIVVDTADATLICPRNRAQDVRQVVDILKKRGAREGITHTTVFRPWGSYTVLETGPGFKIKKIQVMPGAKLSLQMHRRRSEHWVVVAGTAKVTRGKEVYRVKTNESTYIPMRTRHRLENPGKKTLKIIEVQNGAYLEEDDITRYDDDYKRRTGR